MYKTIISLVSDSEITTYDLPDDDPIFTETYERNEKDKRSIFINKNSL